MATKHPGIPRLQGRKRDVEALTESMDLLTGTSGDPLAKALTLADLQAIGLIDLVSRGGTVTGSPTGAGGSGGGGSSTITQPDTPTQPTGVTATGAFTAIYVGWDQPTYHGHLYTEIYRSAANNFGTAVRIGTQQGTLFADPAGPGADFYYWVRHVNTNGVVGPINATAGTHGQSAPNISQIMTALSDKLNESLLSNALNTRISLIDTPVSGLIDRLNAEVSARQTGDSQLQVQIESIVLSNIADVYYQATMPTGTINEGSRWFDTDDGNHPYLYLNGAWVDVSDQRILDLQAAVVTEQSARISADTAQVGRLTALEATVNNPATGVNASASGLNSLTATVTAQGGSITANATEISQIQAVVGTDYAALQQIKQVTIDPGGMTSAYFLKTDVNGYIAGFGLVNTGITSQFIVKAGTFAIADPATPTVFPFIVNAGKVYLANALIQDAAITNAQIHDLAADKITAGFISVDRFAANSITAQKIDSRGLSIKDLLGNEILSVGTQLDYSHVANGPAANANFVDLNWLYLSAMSLSFNPDMQIQGADGRPAGVKAVYGGGNPATISYLDAPKTILKLASTTDTTLGVGFPAMRVVGSDRYTITIRVRASAAVASGFYFRVHELDTELPTGTTHVSVTGEGSETGVATATREVSIFAENVALGVTFTDFTFTYVPTSTAKYASCVFLKWTGFGTNELYIKRCMVTSNADVTGQNIAAGFQGQGPFATLTQITSANISTYIAAAAIDTAYIRNAAITTALIANLAVDTGQINTAAVKTLKIGANQVTVPISSFAAAPANLNYSSTSPVLVRTAVITNPDTVGPINVLVLASLQWNTGSSVFPNEFFAAFRILKNGVPLISNLSALYAYTNSNDEIIMQFSYSIVSTLNAAETATYVFDFAPNGFGGVIFQNRSLTLIGAAR